MKTGERQIYSDHQIEAQLKRLNFEQNFNGVFKFVEELAAGASLSLPHNLAVRPRMAMIVSGENHNLVTFENKIYDETFVYLKNSGASTARSIQILILPDYRRQTIEE